MVVIKRVMQYEIKYCYFNVIFFFLNPNALDMFWLNMLLSVRYNYKNFRAQIHQMR